MSIYLAGMWTQTQLVTIEFFIFKGIHLRKYSSILTFLQNGEKKSIVNSWVRVLVRDRVHIPARHFFDQSGKYIEK